MISQRVLLFSLAFMLLFTVGCDKEDTIPNSPPKRVQAIADQLPSNVEAFVFLADLKKTRETLNVIKARMPENGQLEAIQKSFQKSFGIDLLDRESWKRSGIAADSSAGIGMYRSRVIFMTYVDNRQQFEKLLTDKAKSAFQIESVTKSQTISGHKMKVLSDDPARQIAWLYVGKMAVVVLPATSVRDGLEEGSVTLVLADIVGTKKDKSLGKAPGFQKFMTDLGTGYPVSLYLNPSLYLEDEDIKKAMESDPQYEAGAAWAKQNLNYAGAGIRGSDTQLDVVARLGLKPEIAKKALEAIKGTAKFDWNGFATDKVLLGVRLAVDWPKMWNLFTNNLPEDQQRGLRRDLKMTGEGINIDIEQDILNKLTGNVGVFFYGIGGGLKDVMQFDPSTIAQRAGLMVVLQFKTPEDVKSLVAKLMGPLAMMANIRPMVIKDKPIEGWQVMEFNTPNSPGRVYIVGDRIMFATTAFSPESVFDYASNKRDEKRLKDVKELDLGNAFASEDGFSGVYFNSARARENLGGLLLMVQEAKLLNEIEEASLKLGVEKEGGFAHLLIDLVPKKGTDTTLDKKGGDDKAKKADAKK